MVRQSSCPGITAVHAGLRSVSEWLGTKSTQSMRPRVMRGKKGARSHHDRGPALPSPSLRPALPMPTLAELLALETEASFFPELAEMEPPRAEPRVRVTGGADTRWRRRRR